MLPQPPPNAPAPPPSEAAMRSQRWWKWIVVIGISSILAVLFLAILLPYLVRKPNLGHRAEAVSNAKQVGLALFTFQEDYGSYPSADTAAMVKNNHPDATANFGNTSSNDFFRQLIAAGEIDQESPFYAQITGCRRPDNVMTGARILEKGEVGFSYVISHANCKEEDLPLILTPLVKGKMRFDYRCAKEFFNGRVIVLSADFSFAIHPVDRNGRVILNGKDFFDPSQPYWHGIPPKVAWPE